jgi:hypothetical protein
LIQGERISRSRLFVNLVDQLSNLLSLIFSTCDQVVDISEKFCVLLFIASRCINADELEIIDKSSVPGSVPPVQPFVICILELQLRLWTDTNAHGRVDNLMEDDRICLEPHRHSLLRKVPNVVLVDVMLAASTLDKLYVCGVEVQFQELSKGVPLHLVGDGDKWRR